MSLPALTEHAKQFFANSSNFKMAALVAVTRQENSMCLLTKCQCPGDTRVHVFAILCVTVTSLQLVADIGERPLKTLESVLGHRRGAPGRKEWRTSRCFSYHVVGT